MIPIHHGSQGGQVPLESSVGLAKNLINLTMRQNGREKGHVLLSCYFVSGMQAPNARLAGEAKSPCEVQSSAAGELVAFEEARSRDIHCQVLGVRDALASRSPFLGIMV